MRRRVALVSVVVAVALISTVLIAFNRTSRAADAARWVGSWAAAQHAAALTGLSQTGFDDQTIRMTVRTSVGGDGARLRLSNVFGTKSLVIGDVTVGVPADHAGADLKPDSLHDVTFGGRRSVTIPQGAEMMSDPVTMTVPALSPLTVSLWLPQETGPTTFHTVSRATSFVSKGNHAGDVSDGSYTDISIPNPIPGHVDSPWFYLSGVDVLSHDTSNSIVVFGDSISDGFQSSLATDHRWPDRLADRLAKLPASRHAPGILNESLSGNSLDHQAPGVPQIGPNAIARLHRDVVSQTGVHTVILEIGINDLLIWGDDAGPIVTGLKQVAGQLHEAGLRVVVCTLGPWHGWPTWTAEKDKVRMAVNAYLYSTHDFDAVVDLDALLRDADEPDHIKPSFDSGDHLHPNDAGYAAIATAMPLDVLVPA